MESMHRNSEHALASAIMTELDRLGETPLHGAIHLSYKDATLPNGIRRCSVQLECKAGCGYLIQAVGEEADILHQKTTTIQALLAGACLSQKSLLEDLLLLFPDFVSKSSQLSQCINELTS